VSFSKTPAGTRGRRGAPGFLMRLMTPLMLRIHRRSHDRMGQMDLLYLTTVGARSGQSRTTPLARFDDGRGGWFVVASAGGTVSHPGWYHNIAAHPDQVQVEVAGVTQAVRVEQLSGEARAAAWQQITTRAPGFLGYESRTDRELPVLRLTPEGSADPDQPSGS
jgi:deazaflavin-dependent oxidoreductase (nitroreductase family)